MQQHTVFKKYTRDWLHEMTGYSKTYLCRVASGNVPLSRSFIDRVSFKLNEPVEALFLLDAASAIVPAKPVSSLDTKTANTHLPDKRRGLQ